VATTIVPGTHTGFNRQTWADTVEGATYQRSIALPLFQEYPGRVLNQGNVRKKARANASTLAQTDTGTSLTASQIAGTPITLTPVGRYVAVYWSQNEDAQVEFDLNAEAAAEIEKAMAEALDTAVLANAVTFTNSMSQAGLDPAMVRQAVGRLMGNTNGMFAPGDVGGKMNLIVSNTQYPNIMGMPEWTNADVRGDSENPHVQGIWARGGGVYLFMTTVVTQDANGWHNLLAVQSAIINGWNQRTQVIRDQVELEHRVTVYSNFASSVLHDARAIDLRSTASAL
jgi:hypothetical protein